MPVVDWRVGDDAEQRIEHREPPFRVFNHDRLSAGLSDGEMDRRREAKRRLDDGDDADLVDCRADLGSNGRC
jgi:hypothetical protein